MPLVKERVEESTNGLSPADTVTLGIRDRLSLLTFLPKEGDILTLRVIRDLRGELALSEEELKEGDLRFEEGTLIGNAIAANLMKTIPIGAVARGIIKSSLESVSKSKKLTEDCIDLYERFVEKD
jgi:hypothetical protein